MFIIKPQTLAKGTIRNVLNISEPPINSVREACAKRHILQKGKTPDHKKICSLNFSIGEGKLEQLSLFGRLVFSWLLTWVLYEL